MTGEQHELAVNIVDAISQELEDLVDLRLQGADPEVEELVRTLLTEQMRFWKRG
jgi:hypothetical protein